MQSTSLYDEKALLLQVAAGNQQAFRMVFDAYRNRLYFYIFRLTLSKEVAEDVLQDTFLKIWLNREHLREVTHFNAYVFRMAQNGVISGLRRKAVEAGILNEKQEQSQPHEIPDQQLHYKQVKGILQKALSRRDTYMYQRQKPYKKKPLLF